MLHHIFFTICTEVLIQTNESNLLESNIIQHEIENEATSSTVINQKNLPIKKRKRSSSNANDTDENLAAPSLYNNQKLFYYNDNPNSCAKRSRDDQKMRSERLNKNNKRTLILLYECILELTELKNQIILWNYEDLKLQNDTLKINCDTTANDFMNYDKNRKIIGEIFRISNIDLTKYLTKLATVIQNVNINENCNKFLFNLKKTCSCQLNVNDISAIEHVERTILYLFAELDYIGKKCSDVILNLKILRNKYGIK
ncbi:uncharacterized protein VNE69_12033 [Vairimorpha necatrix]|uniref:Uncharacterized protein n=1 Tax=Vairimorpha necatrix TaxID=6039 RepID=A0AAX4JGM6_9MICR